MPQGNLESPRILSLDGGPKSLSHGRFCQPEKALGGHVWAHPNRGMTSRQRTKNLCQQVFLEKSGFRNRPRAWEPAARNMEPLPPSLRHGGPMFCSGRVDMASRDAACRDNAEKGEGQPGHRLEGADEPSLQGASLAPIIPQNGTGRTASRKAFRAMLRQIGDLTGTPHATNMGGAW